VTHDKVNATLPKGVSAETLTMDEAVAALTAKAAGIIPGVRSLGEHPGGGSVSVRAGRFGPYVNWGKVNANIPKSTPPESITLEEAVQLLADREGKPVKAKPAAKAKAAPKAKSAPKVKAEAAEKPVPAKKPAAKKALTKKAPAKKTK
jgi:DNA topoisomerase-1